MFLCREYASVCAQIAIMYGEFVYVWCAALGAKKVVV